MFEQGEKTDSEIIGQIIGFTSFKNYKGELITYINIKCYSKDLEESIEESFTYSKNWSKFELKIGDKVKFQAKIKRMELVVHKTQRWHDERGTLPLELTDIEVQIQIKNPKLIVKL